MKAPNRTRVARALSASFAFLAIAFGSSVVRGDVVAIFGSANTGDYTYTGDVGGTGTTSTLTQTGSPTPLSGVVIFGPQFFTPVGPYAATIDLSATSSTAASGQTQTGFSGSYSITNNSGGSIDGVANGGTLLTVSFTSATLNDNGGGSFTFGGPATITAFLGNPLSQPESFGLALSGATATGLGSFGFNNFIADDINVSSATVVPEPSSLVLAGVGALGMIGYGLRRRKVLGA